MVPNRFLKGRYRVQSSNKAVFFSSFLVMLFASLQSGCYLLKQGSYLLTERLSAVPVEKIVKSEDITSDEELFFRNTNFIRQFAVENLGLKESRNYTTFIRTDKSFLAAVVSGAGNISLSPYLWKFPLVGSVPYKGFFTIADAEKEAERLSAKGYDTWIRGVDAFSTLGFSRDPLYSFMTDYPIHRLAEILIHEQIHATIWVKNSSQFNEELASFAGEIGARDFIISMFGRESDELDRMEKEKRDRERWLEDITGLRRELEALYSDSLEDSAKEREKSRIIAGFKEEFGKTYTQRYETKLYEHVPEIPINNAFIALYHTYYGNRKLFEEMYQAYDGDLAEVLRKLSPLDGASSDPYEFMHELTAALASP